MRECDMTYFKSQGLSSLLFALSSPADCSKVYYAT